jgi:hypothetical protein
MPCLCKSSLMNRIQMRGSLNCRFLFAITAGYGFRKAKNSSRAAPASAPAMQAEEMSQQHQTIKTAETVTQMVP